MTLTETRSAGVAARLVVADTLSWARREPAPGTRTAAQFIHLRRRATALKRTSLCTGSIDDVEVDDHRWSLGTRPMGFTYKTGAVGLLEPRGVARSKPGAEVAQALVQGIGLEDVEVEVEVDQPAGGPVEVVSVELKDAAVIAARRGHRVLFAAATDWVARLQQAHRVGRLSAESARLRRYGLIIIDEVGYLPFEAEAANLFFQLVSTRNEHASLVLTSNLAFSAWGGVFGTGRWPRQ